MIFILLRFFGAKNLFKNVQFLVWAVYILESRKYQTFVIKFLNQKIGQIFNRESSVLISFKKTFCWDFDVFYRLNFKCNPSPFNGICYYSSKEVLAQLVTMWHWSTWGSVWNSEINTDKYCLFGWNRNGTLSFEDLVLSA